MERKRDNTLELLNSMEKLLVDSMLKFNTEELMAGIKPKLDEYVKETYGFLPTIHKIVIGDEDARQITGVVHEKFDEVLAIVKKDIPVYLTGKAGTGKNVICKQIAECLGLDFYFTNAVTQEYKLTGFIDANGQYQETQFYKAFTKGGLFFLDEMDASIPETLVILNAAIANRYFDFPTGKVEAHPNFRVIAAGNTVGNGADNNYTGRYSLDRASLDRFMMVYIDYSLAIEEAMANGDRDLVDFAHIFREVTEQAGIECLFSYRTIDRLYKMQEFYAGKEIELLENALFKGLDKDDLNIIKDRVKNSSNKWCKIIVAKG